MSEKERFKPYVAAYLVLVKNGRVLLLRRFNTGYQDGNYSLVAGHLDGGETTKQCIIREASEEAGIVVRPEDLEVVHTMHRLAPDREYFDFYLRAEKWTGDITNMEPDKCDELKWCQIDDLPSNVLPAVKLALGNINNNVHYSEFGWA
ncbi:MAG TPA: NUDIX domain-containing protein [Patescibacteria group bacterium]|nr:NUDIX domain-containing protein [Patescibacteria group bacterium]